MANWERKSQYLLREIVKFRTYIDTLATAQAQKQKIYAEREAREQQELEELHGIKRNMLPNKRPTLLPPVKDDDEYFERSVTFWYAICSDRFASASTNWPVSLEESDITSLLPCRNPSLDVSYELCSCRSLSP